MLGSYEPVIWRADVGDKGIYYRAQVGPFATADQATENVRPPEGGRWPVHRATELNR